MINLMANVWGTCAQVFAPIIEPQALSFAENVMPTHESLQTSASYSLGMLFIFFSCLIGWHAIMHSVLACRAAGHEPGYGKFALYADWSIGFDKNQCK